MFTTKQHFYTFDSTNKQNTTTMKSSTISKRLAKIEMSHNNFAFKVAKDLIEGTNSTGAIIGAVIRPCHTSGHGRFTSNQDFTDNTIKVLYKLGLKFEVGNDAPKGGKTGNFIKLKTKIVA